MKKPSQMLNINSQLVCSISRVPTLYPKNFPSLSRTYKDHFLCPHDVLQQFTIYHFYIITGYDIIILNIKTVNNTAQSQNPNISLI